MILQKSYRPDFRTKVDKVNHGEVTMYNVKHSHEAIIEQSVFDAVQEEIKKRREETQREASPLADTPHLFSGFIRCGNCGRMFAYHRTNAKKYDKPVWICPSYFSMGKDVCPSQKIPADILVAKTCEVLGIGKISRSVLEQSILEIVVPEHNRLIYHLKDGSITDICWEHASRKYSWTQEMRQKAREKALERHRKERN